MSSNTTCSLCHWSGPRESLGVSPYVMGGICPRCGMGSGIRADDVEDATIAAPAPPPSPLEIAIAGSTALDPAGNRRTAEQLKVPSFEERQAQYALDAERIAGMGRVS